MARVSGEQKMSSASMNAGRTALPALAPADPPPQLLVGLGSEDFFHQTRRGWAGTTPALADFLEGLI